MALFDLNRAGDTPIATLKLAEIAPLNWHKFPPRVASMADANQNATKPRYDSMTDWVGGVVGDDVDVATATVALARDDGGANEADYSPRNQQQKATALGVQNPLAVDISRARGAIAPQQPYPKAGDAAPAAPVISSLSPNTAVAGVGAALVVDIIGTGFTPWSTVTSGNYPIPAAYVSPTLMRIGQWPRNSVPGVVQVVVSDHDVNSAPSNFTFT